MSLDDRSFAGPTAVGRYWIAHAEGFAVQSARGRTVGVVESVTVDPRTSETLLVLERSTLLRTRRGLVPAQRVADVLPWSRRLVLAKPPRAARQVPALRLGDRAGATSTHARRAWARTRPHAAAALRAGGQLLHLAAAVVAAVALVLGRTLRAYARWLVAVTPPAARAVRAWLGRALREVPWRQWLHAVVRVVRAGARRVPVPRRRRPVLSGTWARRSRSGA